MNSTPFISFLITCCNEVDTLRNLFSQVGTYVVNNKNSELVIIIDKDATDNTDTKNLLCELETETSPEIVEEKRVKMYEHPLNKDYGSHKNFGKSKCFGKWICQIDGDESLSETLLENLSSILEMNIETELIWVPRVNIFTGVTEEHAKQWGWDINNPNKWINWNTGDYQSRIFQNLPTIKWENRLHEKIVGAKTFSILPKEEIYALYHHKTIQKQIETNLRYNALFTKEENLGVSNKR